MFKPVVRATTLTPVQAGAHVAVAVRVGDRDRETVARQNLAEARITAAVQRALAASPPLTHAQVKRLSNLLRGSAK